MYRLKSVFGVFLIFALLLWSLPAIAQDELPPEEEGMVAPPTVQPPMENVFYNTLWGALLGGVVMISAKMLDDSDPTVDTYSPSYQFDNFVTGATGGAFVGVAVGFYMAWNDIQLDAKKSRIASMENQSSPDSMLSVPLQNPKKIYANLDHYRGYKKISGIPIFVYHHKF